MSRQNVNKKIDNPLSFLNVFKIIAAFCVFLIHYPLQETIMACPCLSFLTYGTQPVSIFFVMSGVLFFVAYYGKIKDNKLTFKDFFLKRIIKFWPLIVIIALCSYICALVLFFGGQELPVPLSVNFLDLLMLLVFGGPTVLTGEYGKIFSLSWYICVLMFCYLIAFLLTKLDKKIKNKTIFLLPLILGFLMVTLECQYPFFNVLTGTGLFSFFLGFFIGFILPKFNKITANKKTIIRICALILPIFYIVMFYFPELSNVIFVYPAITVPLVLVVPLLFVFYDLKGFNNFARSKPLQYLTDISYDFYLLHCVGIGMFISLDSSIVDTWWMIILTFLCCLAISILSYHFINTKIVNHLNKKLGYAR